MMADQEGGGAVARCDCCKGVFHRPAFAISTPRGNEVRRVCTRCASHAELKADGDLWLPANCPDAPRPRLRVWSGAAGRERG